MKKIANRSLATMLGMIILLLSAASQDLAMNQKSADLGSVASESKEEGTGIPYINNVNGRVLKSFHRSFGDRPDARWSKTDNGFMVHFKDSNMSTNVYYRPKGTVDYRVNYYFAERLPGAVRHTVKSNFYDYSIIQVSEVHKDESVCYFVKIENTEAIKTIRVVGQEWQQVEEIKKQKAGTVGKGL
ncbi:MAG TPA: hypothetical protein VFR58_06895 [Flavisolibacter sp.]|nr:hypothetical protein [Flavisolibacter sp.]